MQKFKYNMSVIIPIYNMGKYLRECLNSIINQDTDLNKIEIIAINDGSSDDSLNILEEYADKYDNIVVINQENQGLSKTRNNGIKIAQGKYIMCLDPDDTISKDTVGSLVEFFDKHYDEIDLLAYKIIPVTNGKLSKKLHYRYQYLNHDGIYDLNKYIYACITTINHCVKNLGKDRIYFDETPGFRQEDQKYALDVINRKMKIGYITKGTYYYLQHESSVVHSKFHAYYVWDKSIAFWEKEFLRNPCPYLQAMFMHDLSWKMSQNKLFPYQYEGEEYDEQIIRLQKLLNQVSDDVILNHPGIPNDYKYFFINMKTNNHFIISLDNNLFAVANNDKIIYSTNKLKLNILKMKIEEKCIKLIGYIYDPIFSYTSKPQLFLVDAYESNKKKEVALRESSYSYINSSNKIGNAFMFETIINTDETKGFNFEVCIDEKIINCEFWVKTSICPFGSDIGRNVIFKYHKKYELTRDRKSILITNYRLKEKIYNRRIINNYYFYNDIKRYIFRKIILLFKFFKHKNTWLYYDCKGVEKDNAYYQFIHDINKKDGVKRYYVSANTKEDINKLFSFKNRRKVIRFKSLKHKLYYTIASKIITAYSEDYNCQPYTQSSLKKYNDLFEQPEIIYLQHGILHAHTPDKYHFDRLFIDKEVISSNYEKENLINNYGFTLEHLILSGMPRYDFISQNNESKKVILFAPSWRSWLIGRIKNEWKPTIDIFKDSSFYDEVNTFLNSKELNELLEKYDYILNFQLHPIFKPYKKLFNINNSRIKINDNSFKESDYKVFITDFSSYVFDFVYLKRSILYFFPDYDLFKAGFNYYRELDLKFEDGFGPFTKTANELISNLEKLLKNDGKPEKKYYDRANNFFLYNDNNQRERIYEELIKSEER